jgi:hypothetical protein
MRWSILAFCVGVLAAQCLRELPGLPLVGGLLCLALPAVRYRCWPLVALFLGLGWAVWRAHCALEARLPVALEDQALQIEGRVLGLPEAAPRLTRFAFKPSQLSLDGRPLALRPRQLLLVSYAASFSPPAGTYTCHTAQQSWWSPAPGARRRAPWPATSPRPFRPSAPNCPEPEFRGHPVN